MTYDPIGITFKSHKQSLRLFDYGHSKMTFKTVFRSEFLADYGRGVLTLQNDYGHSESSFKMATDGLRLWLQQNDI